MFENVGDRISVIYYVHLFELILSGVGFLAVEVVGV